EPHASPAGSFARTLADSQRTQEETLARIDTALAALRGQIEERRQELAVLGGQREALRPLVEAKRQHHWWNKAWWQATFAGDSLPRWTALSSHGQQLQADVQALEQQTRSLTEERQ